MTLLLGYLNMKVYFSKEYLIFHCKEGEFFKADQIFIYDILWLIKILVYLMWEFDVFAKWKQHTHGKK